MARQLTAALLALVLSTTLAAIARASDHLDSPATVANPQADISDVYAWTSPDGRQLNLVMTILAHSLSDKVKYALHVGSGDPTQRAGLKGRNRRFRVYAARVRW